jgi:plastocyanin
MNISLRLLVQRGLLLCSLLLPAAASQSATDAKISIDNFTFSPTKLVISKGTEVTWTNKDDIPHTIVLMDGSTRSKALDTDNAFSYRFDKAGTYAYICGLHPHMHGQIVVR